MKTIFIPTDFSLNSLDCITNLCEQNENEPLNFIFVHAFKLSDSISELLMLSRRSREYEYIPDGFYERCNQIKAECPQVESIRTEFFFGSTMATFRNFLEANDVTCILNPKDCSYTSLNKSSLDPFAFTSKCGLPIVSVLTIKKLVTEQVENAPAATRMVAEAY
ncbi:hypothetical protein [Pedobacter antarcticus]|uniref:hypothetical protein n=1 Tax=Pedobacter antarcticus TaxID=34086 RepID=UPI00292D702E|nr:hypothetical protein [Pedobacter antarcticus]